MASLNKVHLIGRLTRDPESRTFSNGGKVTAFGFAVTGQRKKNANTGEWEEEPCFLDVKAFNRGDYGKLADLAEQYLKKGQLAYIEGHLVLEQWEKDGAKRQALKVIADQIQFLQPKDSATNAAPPRQQAPRTAPPPQGPGGFNTDPDSGEEIPF